MNFLMKKSIFSVHATKKSQYHIIYFVRWNRETTTQCNIPQYSNFNHEKFRGFLEYFSFSNKCCVMEF